MTDYASDSKKIASEERAIKKAMKILENRLDYGPVLQSPDNVKNYLRLRIGAQPAESFGVLWLSNRHSAIACEELFSGTIDGASVYPREIVRHAIEHNAAACILYHNHPSGYSEPSQADQRITAKVKDTLALIDVRVLDHIIVSASESYSFAEHGLI